MKRLLPSRFIAVTLDTMSNTHGLPTTPVLNCHIDRLFHEIDHYEYLAATTPDTTRYYATTAYHYTCAAIILGLRNPEIGPKLSEVTS